MSDLGDRVDEVQVSMRLKDGGCKSFRLRAPSFKELHDGTYYRYVIDEGRKGGVHDADLLTFVRDVFRLVAPTQEIGKAKSDDNK